MGIGLGLGRVLSEYTDAKSQPYAGHPLASAIRGELADALRSALPKDSTYKVKGSPGQDKWSRGPWVGVFDPIVTSSAQSGFYIVYLFREDMRGVYLSLNQGMTEAKELYGANAKHALRSQASSYRMMLSGGKPNTFDEGPIDLVPSGAENPTAYYQAGNIVAKYYEAPIQASESELVADLHGFLGLYKALIYADSNARVGDEEVQDAPEHVLLIKEDATRFRVHKRIERSAKNMKIVKEKKGYRCEVCETNLEDVYGIAGREFIEAHHLNPLSAIKGTTVTLDPEKDFAVLCPNCHRMVHRSGLISDVEKFKRDFYRGK